MLEQKEAKILTAWMRAPDGTTCRICAGCGCPGEPEKSEQQNVEHKEEGLN